MIVQSDDKDFSRDISSKALINTNRASLEEYKAKRNMTKRLNDLEENMRKVEFKLDNISALLLQLVNK